MQEEQCSSTGGAGLGNGLGGGGVVTPSSAIVNLKCIADDYAAALQIKADPSYSDVDESDLEVA